MYEDNPGIITRLVSKDQEPREEVLTGQGVNFEFLQGKIITKD